MPSLIVFSHLRWNFVYQRPQHLLSRLARQFPVVFVEEPITDAHEDRLEHLQPAPGIDVLRPHVRASATGFHDDHLPALSAQLAQFLAAHGISDYMVWLYTPMALPLLSDLQPRAVVYDCMDELSAFRGAPRQLLQRESALYQVADLVLTGGPSLYEAKRQRHAHVHLFSSSVDAAHFASGQDHPAQQHLPQPRLGYTGVIDERLDLALVAAVADAHPDWQVVMVGPVVKIDVHSLPQRPNIHWMGQQPYEELPSFMAGWQVCLMPFALNEATRFISPTKTLEYMAAGKPTVSTPIRDVVQPYAGVVDIAHTPADFVQACERLMAEPPAARAQRASRMAEVVAGTSWDQTASAIEALLQGLLQARPARSKQAANSDHADHASVAIVRPAESGALNATGRRPPTLRREPPTHPTVILGAGPTGLAAAMHLGADALLLEKGPAVGGWCRSIKDQGFTFDCAGHIMFSNDEYVLALYKTLLGENVHWQNREAWIYSKAVYTRYPFQGALYGLPPEVLKECLVGAIEARFGPLKKESSTSAVAGVIAKPQQAPKNFEDFIYKVWGAGVAKHFAIPYNRKLWAVPLHEMETSWLGGRVPMPDLEEMIEGGLQPVPKPMGPNARFGYPLQGGFQALMDGFLPQLKGPMQLGAEVVAVSPSRRSVTLADGRVYGYDSLISTMPLPKLVEAMGEEAPEAVRTAAQSLRHVSVRCVNLGIGREHITDKHWIYYPEDTVFHRIFVQGNASPHCNPPGGFGLTCEISYSDYKPLPCEGQALIDRCIADCKRVGLIRDDDPVWAANEVDMPYAYVVYDHARAQHVETIRRWMGQARIVLAGRYSEWEYYNSDHAFLAGRKAAEQVRQLPSATFTSSGASTVSARELQQRQAAAAVAMAATAPEAGQRKPAA